MKSPRLFHSVTALLILAITLIGFRAFYLSGHGAGGRVIAPAIFPTVAVHGLAITGWYLLSVAQALLIARGGRPLHMRLGWVTLGLGPVIAVSGVLTAVRSARGAPPEFDFFGMHYRSDFLLVMLTEMAVFTCLVAAGLLARKKPERHRGLMVAASLSLLLGATTRIPWLVALFGGEDSRLAFFGPVFALGALLLVARWALDRRLERGLAAGYLFMVAAYLGAEQLSRTEAWRALAGRILGG